MPGTRIAEHANPRNRALIYTDISPFDKDLQLHGWVPVQQYSSECNVFLLVCFRSRPTDPSTGR